MNAGRRPFYMGSSVCHSINDGLLIPGDRRLLDLSFVPYRVRLKIFFCMNFSENDGPCRDLTPPTALLAEEDHAISTTWLILCCEKLKQSCIRRHFNAMESSCFPMFFESLDTCFSTWLAYSPFLSSSKWIGFSRSTTPRMLDANAMDCYFVWCVVFILRGRDGIESSLSSPRAFCIVLIEANTREGKENCVAQDDRGTVFYHLLQFRRR